MLKRVFKDNLNRSVIQIEQNAEVDADRKVLKGKYIKKYAKSSFKFRLRGKP